MTGILILLALVLVGVIIVQIGKVSELNTALKADDEAESDRFKSTGILLMVFMVVFLVGCIWSSIYYRDSMLGYGPWISSSLEGLSIDRLIKITLFFTGIVFVLTHIYLFYYSYKYRERTGRKAKFFVHNNTLEIVWTAIPAVVMTFLVIGGLDVWNEVMADVPEDAVAGEDYIEVEAMGVQFQWYLRHPGADNYLGARDFRLIDPGSNDIGQDWTDVKNHDDILPSELVLPVNKPVRVRILARDVLHNFFLPHFRVKMDAIPGMPTYFVFTPITTTEEMRQRLKDVPEYQVPDEPNDPASPMKWEVFDYELACAELCGKGHYSMRRIVKIVSEEEYNAWLAEQQPYYLSTIKGTDADTYLSNIENQDAKEGTLSLAK